MDESQGNVRFVISRNVIVELPCKTCAPFSINPSIPFFTRDWLEQSLLIIRDWLYMVPPTSCLESIKGRLVSALHISCIFTCQHDETNRCLPQRPWCP
ncbi:hypothetical protein TNCV_813191 [Trichonephila clavipes]|nr:hypothetical protein TNCV_813191 [Trichonephila clavipes]